MINGTIWVNDRHEIIRNAEDLVQLIREHVGNDIAKMVQTLVDMTDKAAHLAETDFAAYERALDGAIATMREIDETVDLIRSELDERRIDRAVIRDMLNDIERWVGEHI